MKKTISCMVIALTVFLTSTPDAESFCIKYQSMKVADTKSKIAYFAGGRAEVMDMVCKTAVGAEMGCFIGFRKHLKDVYGLEQLSPPDQFIGSVQFDTPILAEDRMEEWKGKVAKNGYKIIKTEYVCDYKLEKKSTIPGKAIRQ